MLQMDLNSGSGHWGRTRKTGRGHCRSGQMSNTLHSWDWLIRIRNVHHLIVCIMQTSISKIINQDMLLIIELQLNATGNALKEVNIQSMKTLGLCDVSSLAPRKSFDILALYKSDYYYYYSYVKHIYIASTVRFHASDMHWRKRHYVTLSGKHIFQIGLKFNDTGNLRKRRTLQAGRRRSCDLWDPQTLQVLSHSATALINNFLFYKLTTETGAVFVSCVVFRNNNKTSASHLF